MRSVRILAGAICLWTCWLVAAVAAQSQASTPAPQPVGSLAKLAQLLGQKQPQYYFGTPQTAAGGLNTSSLIPNVIAPTIGAPSAGTGSSGGSSGAQNGGDVPFSTTNLQVAGVDEADIVKTDGEYIYQIDGAEVLVIHAFPENVLSVKMALAFDSDFQPTGLYLDGNNLVVIGGSFRTLPVMSEVFSLPSETVKAIVFDVTNKDNITSSREVELDGNYVSSRRIGDALYLIARKYPDFYLNPLAGGIGGTGGSPGPNVFATTRAVTKHGKQRPHGLVPAIRDTRKRKNAKFERISPRNIFFFPEFIEPSYLVIASFNIADPKVPLDAQAYLGAGGEVYASAQNLYVSAALFPPIFFGVTSSGNLIGSSVTSNGNVSLPAPTPLMPTIPPTGDLPFHSQIYKFALNGGHAIFKQRGDVPGTILNQFSMDEFNGFFRVATTTNVFTTVQSFSGVYVLDDGMNTVGKVEGIAPGERLFAARFIGNRAYLVAFKMIDPLFVVDLSQSTAPAVLGQLIMPGFSNYLHPFDDTHLLGFGKDTVNGLYQGVKVVLFDVSDVNNPVVNSSVTIGDRGTNSEVLYDPKALLFDSTSHLLVLPIQVFQIANKTAATPLWTYGVPTFNGAYAYNVTVDNGFVLKGAITHVSPGEDTLASLYDRMIHRSLFIANDLYTLSNTRIKVNDINSLAEKASLDLPVQPSVLLPSGTPLAK